MSLPAATPISDRSALWLGEFPRKHVVPIRTSRKIERKLNEASKLLKIFAKWRDVGLGEYLPGWIEDEFDATLEEASRLSARIEKL